MDKVGWGQKVMEMGQGTDKDKKGKKGGCTMTHELAGSLSVLNRLSSNKLRFPHINVQSSTSY